MTWNAVQRAHCLETYFRSNSWEQALRTLRREWGRRSVPGRRTLQRWVNSFRERGVLSHAEHQAHGHRTPTTVLRKITRAVRRNPHHSVRQLSRRTGASKSTIHRILRRQLGLFPYTLQLTQRLRQRMKEWHCCSRAKRCKKREEPHRARNEASGVRAGVRRPWRHRDRSLN